MTTTLQLLQAAQFAQREADRLTESLVAAIKSELAQALRPGAQISLRRERGMPMFLQDVKTIRGADRGTQLFRLAGHVTIDMMPNRLSEAKWEASAVPISEKTGKDMSGRSHGANSRDVVRLRGSIFPLFMEAHPDDARLLQMLAESVTKACATEAGASA